MIRLLRKRLAEIRYHSASRPRTVWTRAIDASIPVTAVLAVAATIAMERFVTRDQDVASQRFMIEGAHGTDDLAAIFVTSEDTGRLVRLPWGECTLRLVQRRHGWPMASRLEVGLLLADVNDYGAEGVAHDTVLAADDPVRRAIDGAFARAERRGAALAPAVLAATWRGMVPPGGGRFWWGTVLGAGIWWVMLFVVSVLSLRTLQFLALYARVRRSRRAYARASRGRCAKCGYDLTGLEFSERCPECGALTGVIESA